jgi:DUF2924 family protein
LAGCFSSVGSAHTNAYYVKGWWRLSRPSAASIGKACGSWTDWHATAAHRGASSNPARCSFATIKASATPSPSRPMALTGRGPPYPSLSAIARAITGTAWSGPRFFTLARGNGRPSVHGPHHKRARAGRKAPATGSNITAGGAFSEQNSRKADPINLVNVQYYRGHRLGRKDHNRIIHTRPHGARVMPNLFAALCAVHEPPRGRRHHIPPPMSFGDAPEAGF